MIGIAGLGTYLPPSVRTSAEIASATGIPEEVIRTKFGIRHVHVAGPEDGSAAMATRASELALAEFPASDLDLVIYCGSQHKEYGLWSAATEVARRVGALHAAAFELNALCAGMPLALKTARGLMAEDPEIRSALLVGGGHENDLVDYGNHRGRFLSNFGAGMGALLVVRDSPNPVLGAAAVSDPRCAMDVYINPDTGNLDVTDPEGMKARLDPESLPNFIAVARRAMAQAAMDHIDFVAITHMKRSMHEAVLSALGVELEQSEYLEDTGHMQAADQVVGLERALRDGRVRSGSNVLLLAAGTGYTWSAAAIRWG
jgi:3-oxoacyl-[acyl-carrier-protein] synthase III